MDNTTNNSIPNNNKYAYRDHQDTSIDHLYQIDSILDVTNQHQISQVSPQTEAFKEIRDDESFTGSTSTIGSLL